MEFDKERIEKYLSEIAAEKIDVETILKKPDAEILKDQHHLKSFKYSTIVIVEAMASILQHFIPKRHNVDVSRYIRNSEF